MLDLTGILFSSIMMLVVILRAVHLDSTIPWFTPLKSESDSSGLNLTPAPARENGTPTPSGRWKPRSRRV